jgi:hypothetical protein
MAPALDPQVWATDVVTAIVRWGIEGAPVANPLSGEHAFRFKSAQEVAEDYRQRVRAVGFARAVDELIEDQARWNAGTGFLTGLGGFSLLPVQLTAAATATWVIQTRLVGAIAHLNGFDLEHEAVRTQILLTLVGEEAGEVLKQVGVKASQQFAQAQLRRLPSALLTAINRAVGFQLVTKFGERGVVNLHRVIPVVGGLVGGGIDYVMTRRLGEFAAQELGRRSHASAGDGTADDDVINVEVIDVRIVD